MTTERGLVDAEAATEIGADRAGDVCCALGIAVPQLHDGMPLWYMGRPRILRKYGTEWYVERPEGALTLGGLTERDVWRLVERGFYTLEAPQ